MNKVKLRNELMVLWSRITPPNFPTDLAEALDGLKRAFWTAAAPAAYAKERSVRIAMERELADPNARVEELEDFSGDDEIRILRDTNTQFRKRISLMQDRIADLETENAELKKKLEG